MRNKLVKGMTAGMVIGAAVGMYAVGNMKNGTKRKIRKSGRMLRNRAEDIYDNMIDNMR